MLTPDELAAIGRLEGRYELIRRATLLTAQGHNTGFCIWGEGGIGKSFQVLKTLREAKTPHRVINTRLTAAGFADLLERNPTAILVLEDIENVFDERTSMNLLRSALWGQEDETGKMRRPITWGVAETATRQPKQFDFDGQIIFTSNRDLADLPELRAIRTRISVLQLSPERAEILAVAKKIALAGYTWHKGGLEPRDTLRIFDFYCEQLPAEVLPNLRTLTRLYRDFIGLRLIGAGAQWREQFAATIRGSIDVPVDTPAARRQRNAKIATELRGKFGANTAKLLPAWKQATGLGTIKSYYDALKRAGR